MTLLCYLLGSRAARENARQPGEEIIGALAGGKRRDRRGALGCDHAGRNSEEGLSGIPAFGESRAQMAGATTRC